jgi:hypothetical protein
MTADRWARIVDAIQYAVGLTVLVAVGLLPVSLLAGAGLWGVKYGLFVVGTLAIGYATLLAWPRSPSDLESEGTDPSETRLQSLIRRAPPAAWYPLSPAERFLDWVRLYLAALFMWASSFGLEVFLGV